MSDGATAGSAGDAPANRRGLLRRWLKVLVVLAGMAIATAIGLYVTLLVAMRGKEVVVPNLVEMTEEDARAAASRLQLLLEVTASRADRRVGAGRVLEQDPPAGSRTRPQRRIRVTMSLGQQSFLMPSFVGQTLRKAQLTLKGLGLRLGSIAHASAFAHPPEEIIAQRPAPGTYRQKGDAVDLLVSRGPGQRVYVMPRLEGLRIEKATEILKDAGMRSTVTRSETASDEEPGVVIDQQPPEGSPVRERQTVRLVVTP